MRFALRKAALRRNGAGVELKGSKPCQYNSVRHALEHPNLYLIPHMGLVCLGGPAPSGGCISHLAVHAYA
eukprot:98418-Pyramimonas_sp.AAC.1